MTGLALEAPDLPLEASDRYLAASALAHHLLMDFAIKILIVVVALVVLGLGMTVIWRRVGRPPKRQRKIDE
ncbi:hypothetical protein [Streptomyces endophytica]|uniref:Uncharacterized protein n=1 Tax=Streptomyces endophytica TaxID=2991496 RepID=A0ABY6P7G5_9ACTN|nr:hypothetical protein [Streptomyces endophytica]UZJ29350.1 hypothetical protein OJ254_01140 [Streptomyces endophytica]